MHKPGAPPACSTKASTSCHFLGIVYHDRKRRGADKPRRGESRRDTHTYETRGAGVHRQALAGAVAELEAGAGVLLAWRAVMSAYRDGEADIGSPMLRPRPGA